MREVEVRNVTVAAKPGLGSHDMIGYEVELKKFVED